MKQSQQSATHAENRKSNGPSQRKESSAPEGVRREHDRYAVDLEVNVQSEHNLYAGLAENLSAGGLFIATHELQKVGSKIELTLRMPDSEQSYNITGEVRWLRLYNEQSDTSPGLGVRFLDLPPGASAAIER